MHNFTALTIFLLLSSCYCAKHSLTNDSDSQHTKEDEIDSAIDKGRIIFLCILLGIGLILCTCACCICVCQEVEDKKARTPCKTYTTTSNTTAGKVYRQLRNKWKAHQSQLESILTQTGFASAMLKLQPYTRQYVTNLINEAKQLNAECEQCFTTKKYIPPLVSVQYSKYAVNINSQSNPQTPVNLAALFQKECALIEALSQKILELRRLIPKPEKRASSGISPFIIGGAVGAAAACAVSAC